MTHWFVVRCSACRCELLKFTSDLGTLTQEQQNRIQFVVLPKHQCDVKGPRVAVVAHLYP